MKIVTAVFASLLAAGTAQADWADDHAKVNRLAAAGDYVGAERVATESLVKGPSGLFSGTGTLAIRDSRGRVRLLLGDTAGAIEDADAIIAADSMLMPPDVGMGLRGLAKAVAGDAAGANADFKAAIDRDKSGPGSNERTHLLYGQRGVARILLDDLVGADADLAHAIAAEFGWALPDDYVLPLKRSWGQTRTAIARLRAGDLPGARDAARDAVQTVQTDRTNREWGSPMLALLVLNKLERQATERIALQTNAVLLTAQQQLSTGDRNAAFRTYVRAYAQPGSTATQDQALQGIALLYPTLQIKPGLPEEARRFLVQSRIHVEEKNFPQAISLYDKAILLAPWWPSSHYDKGLLLGQLGKNAEAITSMKRFLALAPASENTREGQDRIYEWELKLERERLVTQERQRQASASATLGGGNQSGCFIATAAFGSALEPQVMVLRRFRDANLMTNAPGRWFVRQYYTYSPPLADYIRERDGLRTSVRLALAPLIWVLEYPGPALATLVLLVATIGFGLRRKGARHV